MLAVLVPAETGQPAVKATIGETFADSHHLEKRLAGFVVLLSARLIRVDTESSNAWAMFVSVRSVGL